MKSSVRGSMLVMALAVVMIVGGMVVSVLTISVAGVKREQGLEQKFKAREIAEAGLDLCLNELRKATDNVDNDGDGTVDEGLEAESGPFGSYSPSSVALVEGNLGRLGTVYWTLADDANNNNLPDFGEQNVTPVAFSGGSFFVWTLFSEMDNLDNDNDGMVDNPEEAGSITAVAVSRYGRSDAQTRFSGLFTEQLAPPNPPLWNPNAAIGVGGNLTVTGSCEVIGTEGNVHANQFLDMQGAASVSGNVTASGGANVSNPGNVGGTIDGAAGAMGIPDVKPSALKGSADFLLKADGTVVDQAGNIVGSGNYDGFSFNAGDQSWTLSGGNITADGTFYVEGGVHVAGGGGNPKNSPVRNISIIATGSIQVSGNLHMKPKLGSLWLVSGGDIKITGTPNQMHEGIILAREQIFIAGNPDLKGVVVGADLDNVETLAVENKITGNMTIEYNGGLVTDIPIVVPSTKFILDPTFSAYEER